MKYFIPAIVLFASTLTNAQVHITNYKEDSTGKKGGGSITVKAFESHESKDTSNKIFDVQVGLLDIGINSLNDKTNYLSAAAQNFLNVPSSLQNANLFSQKVAKSVNVNIYPVVGKMRVIKTNGQRLYVSLGLGFQVYNFRFSKPISYQNITTPEIIMDTINFSKNKISITYLSMPLMFTAKTRMAKDLWLVYGLGVSGGFRINTLQKQISDERGKQKNHDSFNFNDFNACVSGELGIDGYVRLFASYQLTNLYANALEQYPYTIGVRFFGI